MKPNGDAIMGATGVGAGLLAMQTTRSGWQTAAMLPRDADNPVWLADRSDAIASKPAPTVSSHHR
ncbi:hypothetical protein [Pseudomonas psychrophila]|uniref:hypothetical protein n=1 Tax=Pseudomonas psychrophila TaxID=122355 RepID=UPI0011DE3E5F|nr:hypothetical protein [Pseudomonas psychrophila]